MLFRKISTLFMPVHRLHFSFLFLRGIGERPNKRDLWHCIYTMNTNPLLATFWNFFTGKIHFSGAGTKIKGIDIENIFLYKFQVKNGQFLSIKKSGSGLFQNRTDGILQSCYNSSDNKKLRNRIAD